MENEQTECSFDRVGVLPGQAGYALMVSANVASGRSTGDSASQGEGLSFSNLTPGEKWMEE